MKRKSGVWQEGKQHLWQRGCLKDGRPLAHDGIFPDSPPPFPSCSRCDNCHRVSRLAGWFFGIAPLRQILPGLAEIRVNTAFGLIIAGLALLLFDQRDRGARWHGQGSALLAIGAVIGALGLVSLCEYLFDRDLGIDMPEWTHIFRSPSPRPVCGG